MPWPGPANLPGAPVPVLSHPHSDRVLPAVHRDPPVPPFVPIALLLPLGTQAGAFPSLVTPSTPLSLCHPSLGLPAHTWVLTPANKTAVAAISRNHKLVSSLGQNISLFQTPSPVLAFTALEERHFTLQ